MAQPEEPDTAAPAAAPADAKPTVADSIVQHADDLAAELIWDGEHAYIVAAERGHVRTLAVRSTAFKRWMISKMRAHGVKTPTNREQWNAAADIIESRAEEGGTKSSPSIRVAGKSVVTEVGRRSAIYIDLGDDAWKCVKITSAGWSVEPHPADGPYFYRPPRMAALPIPEPGGSIDDLYRVLNLVDPIERMLVPVWIVQANWPIGPYPILPVHGPPGTGKTTTVSVAKALTDPSLSSPESPAVTQPRKPPRDERSIIAAARNNRIVAFDNVSYLDEWLSDALCRLATGAELGDRGLYTDFDEAVFVASRPVVLNGVPDVVAQSDLADRCVHHEARKPEQRIDEAAFWQEFTREWPQLLGVVLDLVSAAIRNWHAAGKTLDGRDVRMRNFARIGESVGVDLGWKPGTFTDAYLGNIESAAAGIAENDPILRPLRHVLRAAGGTWTGTMAELLDALNAVPPLGPDAPATMSKSWPKSPRALSNKFARLDAPLAEVGIIVGDARESSGKRVRDISMSPPYVPSDGPDV